MSESPSDTALRELERTAVELARIAGTEIQAALGGVLAVRYKGANPEDVTPRDPVSEIDLKVETLIRERVVKQFPDHAVVGEEFDARAVGQPDFVWVVDPIDGTQNFINGFPMFASSIGVLYRGQPVVGALWCATTHALRAGTYHARAGGSLYFDEDKLALKRNPAVRRRLVGLPYGDSDKSLPWENRKTGSAALECAFVAAGLLRAAHFYSPNVWDIGGGLALVLAAGCRIVTKDGDGGWQKFRGFGETLPALQKWRQQMVVGEREAVTLMSEAHS